MSDYSYEYFNVSFPQQYVAHVEINRPQKLNAWIEVMWLSLRDIFKRLSYDPDVRCIVISGAGERAFTAGLDVQAASEGALSGKGHTDGARVANAFRRHVLEFQECITAVEKCEKPVIAALHGISYGLALDLSLACDIRLAALTTRFSVKEVDIGLAADIGTLTRLPHANVPMSWIKDVCLTAREFGAEEAMRVGLVSGVEATKESVVQRALGMAGVVAAKSPVAVVGTKEMLNYSRGRSIEEGLNYVAVWNSAYTQTADMRDAMLAGLKKKKVSFAKL